MFETHGERTECFVDTCQLLVRLTRLGTVVLDYANGWVEHLIERRMPRQHVLALAGLLPR